MAIMRVLSGHTSPETAHVTNDYPYSFTLRTVRREWLEYRKGYGYRFMTQTQNPKKTGIYWNKPKASTYAALAAMYVDEHGHIHWASVHSYPDGDTLEQFATTFAGALTGKREQTILAFLRVQVKAQARVTWQVVSGEELRQREAAGEHVETIEEQARFMHKLSVAEYMKAEREKQAAHGA